jgi:hypothetical protein
MEGECHDRFCDERHEKELIRIEASLRAIQNLIDGRVGVIEARLSGMDMALELRHADMERRLEGLNQLRTEVVRDREQFVRKDSYDTGHESLRGMIADMTRRVTIIETRSVTWTLALGGAFAIIQMILHFLK